MARMLWYAKTPWSKRTIQDKKMDMEHENNRIG